MHLDWEITMDVTKAYRKYRRQGIPAQHALAWAKDDPQADYPTLVWGEVGYMPCAHGMVDGFAVTVSVDYEEEPILMGKFTDAYSDRCIQNPDWAGRHSSVYRWYDPMSSVEEHRRDLRKTHARHEAYNLARRYVLDDLKRDAQPEQYLITITVARHGVELAADSLGGFDVPEDPTEATRQVQRAAVDLIPNALDQARTTLDRLKKD